MKIKIKKGLFLASLIFLISFPLITSATEYTYDELNRLVEVRYDNGISVKYTYDAMGNRLTQEVIPNQSPIADAGPDKTAYVEDTLAFDASNSSDPEGDTLTFNWDFGDGGSASGKIVSHSYSSAGSYTAILTLTDEYGATGTDEAIVTINEKPAPTGGGAVYIPTLSISETSISTSAIGEDTATISWSTSLFSTSRVIYSDEEESHSYKSDTPNYGYARSTKETSTKVTGHKVILTDLYPGTIYYFRCVSKDSKEVVSAEYSFTTLGGKILGDINRDKKVDIFDFNLLIVNWGDSPKNRKADLTKDGKVDILDFNTLMVNWTKI